MKIDSTHRTRTPSTAADEKAATPAELTSYRNIMDRVGKLLHCNSQCFALPAQWERFNSSLAAELVPKGHNHAVLSTTCILYV